MLTDYFSMSDEEEKSHCRMLEQLKKSQHVVSDELVHYDTPLTINHEIEALKVSGFEVVEVVRSWEATSILRAYKRTKS